MDREMQERVTAAKLLQGHIADLLPNVLKTIEQLKDADNRAKLEKQIGPWLAKEVAEEIGQMIDCKELLEGLLLFSLIFLFWYGECFYSPLAEIVREVLCERAKRYNTEMGSGDFVGAEAEEEEADEELLWYSNSNNGDVGGL